jgi:D-arabinose 1-dehydrogenase-like Zn-dependent alcohol dehydrogenase
MSRSESSMRAVQVVKAGDAFVLTSLPVPDTGAGQVRIKVYACGVWRR